MLTTKMMSGIRAVLSPLLFTSYVFGTRIIEFPADKPRPWCSFLYILLLWSIYFFLFSYIILYYVIEEFITFLFLSCLNNSIALLSVILGIYYDKKYRSCLRKLAIVDETLETIGMVTDYQKLYTKMLFALFGWFTYITCVIVVNTLWHTEYNNVIYSVCICILYEYPCFVNLVNDMIIISTLGYIELKFEQLSEYLRKLGECNKQEMERIWEHSILFSCQTGHPRFINNEFTTWIVIHLHLELCKISRMLNSIFGLQMTIKMGVYFTFGAICFSDIFDMLFTDNYDPKVFLFMIAGIALLILNIFRLFIINYMCEKITVKANATGDFINRIPYSTFDVVVRENISQFLLQLSLTPLKFYGLGLFQFGLTFFQGFINSMSTVIVILIQSHGNT